MTKNNYKNHNKGAVTVRCKTDSSTLCHKIKPIDFLITLKPTI
jgi:hypothetical protein